jgi:hypothetical protein
MKKLFAVALIAASLSANAFWNSNNSPWGNNNNNYGYQEDNGMFGYNPYDFWDPRWYAEEMSNMFDEFDDDFNNNGYNYNNPYNNNGYNNGYNGYNANGYNPYNNANSPWNTSQPPVAPVLK